MLQSDVNQLFYLIEVQIRHIVQDKLHVNERIPLLWVYLQFAVILALAYISIILTQVEESTSICDLSFMRSIFCGSPNLKGLHIAHINNSLLIIC